MKKEKTISLRRSQQRERLLELLSSTDRHPTADWIYGKLKKEFPKLSLGTVYRNLSQLVEQGEAKKIHFGSTFDRFEAKIAPHYHLICEKCKQIIDIEMPIYKEINNKAKNISGFKVNYHKIDFFGICLNCQKDDK